MALSLVEILAEHDEINQDALADSFVNRFERHRGYGPAMYDLIPQLGQGGAWRTASRSLFNGSGSFGNGGAMRVAPLGAYFADDLGAVVEHAARSAEVTHAHPEGIAGAVAVAVAAAISCGMGATQKWHKGAAFIEQVCPHIPAGTEVRRRVEATIVLPADLNFGEIVRQVGNGTAVTAQDTVPYTIWRAAHYLDSYEEALWRTAAGMGDMDTTCAIVGGIVAGGIGRAAIPAKWLDYRESLPDWAVFD